MPHPIERRFYRLEFPEKERPSFVVADHEMPVLEVSEGGFRYDPAAAHAPSVGERLQGRLEFRRAGAIEVAGIVSRPQGATIVIVLDRPGIPQAAIMEEQRFLMRRYPDRFRRKT